MQLAELKGRCDQDALAVDAHNRQPLIRALLRGNREEDVWIARAAVELARTRVAQAKKALADTTSTAPPHGWYGDHQEHGGRRVRHGGRLAMASLHSAAS